MRTIPFTAALLATTTLSTLPALEIGGWVAVQGQAFTETGSDGQEAWNLSIAAQPEFYHSFDNGVWSTVIEPFARLDAHDSERTHADLRETHLLAVFDSWELKLGVSREFWGTTEFGHLVDIINQTDLVENFDGEDKLGQPMIKGTWFGNWGQLDAFVLTGFRERTFPGRDGRFRGPQAIDTDDARYESGAEALHIDFAVRYSRSWGPLDIGVATFHGTNRDPQLILTNDGRVVPFYEHITQASLDATVVHGQALWKLEALTRDSERERYHAVSGGIEYTVVGIFDSRHDLGLLGEYYWDERGDEATTALQNDIALGLRWVFNDFDGTELLAGLIIDTDGGGTIASLEYQRRLGEHWALDAQLRIFSNTAHDPTLTLFERDDYVQVELAYHF